MLYRYSYRYTDIVIDTNIVIDTVIYIVINTDTIIGTATETGMFLEKYSLRSKGCHWDASVMQTGPCGRLPTRQEKHVSCSSIFKTQNKNPCHFCCLYNAQGHFRTQRFRVSAERCGRCDCFYLIHS